MYANEREKKVEQSKYAQKRIARKRKIPRIELLQERSNDSLLSHATEILNEVRSENKYFGHGNEKNHK